MFCLMILNKYKSQQKSLHWYWVKLCLYSSLYSQSINSQIARCFLYFRAVHSNHKPAKIVLTSFSQNSYVRFSASTSLYGFKILSHRSNKQFYCPLLRKCQRCKPDISGDLRMCPFNRRMKNKTMVPFFNSKFPRSNFIWY